LRSIKNNIGVHYPHTNYIYKSRSICALEAESSSRASRLPGPPLLCQPSSFGLACQWGWGGRPCSFPELISGQGGRARSKAVQLRLMPTYAATLVKRTVLHGATASSHRVSGCGLDDSHHRIDLSYLGAYGAAVGPCYRSVEEQSTVLSAASERGFGFAMQSRQEGPMGMEMVRHPSRWLGRAMAGRSPCQTREIVVRWLLILFSSPQDDAHGRTAKSADHQRLGGKVQHTRLSICDGDISARR
jgi:hypothetical protein